MNLQGVLEAAERSEAAYTEDTGAARAAFEALGMEWVGQYRDGSVQAALTLREGAAYVSISGTRFDGPGGAEDLLKDLNVEGLDVGGGAKVAQGAFEGLFGLWKWVFSSLPPAAPIWVEGHSLGAWRTYYSPLFVPEARLAGLHCFESPKAGNGIFWANYGRDDTVSVVHEDDLFFGYPFVDLEHFTQPPRDHLWLHGGKVEVILPDQWPAGFNLAAHSISAVVAALRALAQG